MYDSHNLSVLSYANGFTLWHYRTTDPIAELRAPEYFALAMDMLRGGDLIVFNASDGDGFTFVPKKELHA